MSTLSQQFGLNISYDNRLILVWKNMQKTFHERIIEILKEYRDIHHGGSARSAADALGLNPDSGIFQRWLRISKNPETSRSPSVALIGPIMDMLGVRLVTPTDSSRQSPCLLDEQTQEISRLEKELGRVHKELETACKERDIYRMKWEGHIEALQAAASAKEKTRIQEAELEKFSVPQLEHYSEEVKL